MYANAEYGKIIGVNHHLDCIGRTDFDMPCGTTQCADLFRAQDQDVIVTQKPLRVLDIHPFAGGVWKAYVFTKTPWYDKNKKAVGTIFHGMDITSATTLELGSLLGKISIDAQKSDLIAKNNYLISDQRAEIKLTPRESEVIFFIIRGKSAKQIAKIFGISHRTVEEQCEHLKKKFNASNKFELIDNAISLGYLNYIPDSLFHNQLSLILRENT